MGTRSTRASGGTARSGTPARPVAGGIRLAFFVVSASLALLSWHHVLGWDLTGADALQLVAAARIDESSSLLTSLAGPEATAAPRPTRALALAGLRAVSGWNAFGYHLFDLLLHAINGFLVAALFASVATRAGHPRPVRLGLASLIVFGLHPLAVEVVPVVARVGDLLATTFFLAGLLALDRVEARLARGVPGVVGPAVFGLGAFWACFALAVGAAPAGAVLLPAAILYVLVVRFDLAIGRRVLHAVLVVFPCLPLAGGVVALAGRDPVSLLVRLTSGGAADLGVRSATVSVARGLFADLAFPGFAAAVRDFLPGADRYAATNLAWIVALGLAIGGALWAVRSSSRATGGTFAAVLRSRAATVATGPTARVALVAIGLVVLHGALFVAAGHYHRRLLYPVTAAASGGAAIVLLAAFDRLRQLRSEMRPRFAHVGAVVALAWGGLLLWGSPLWHRNDEWRSAAATTRLLTGAAEDDWKVLPPGARVHIVGAPLRFSYESMRRPFASTVSSTRAVSDASLTAWLTERFPDKSIHVTSAGRTTWTAPVDDHVHACHWMDGWLLFEAPPVRGPFTRTELGDAAASLQLVDVGNGRRALASLGEPGRDAWVVVFDGTRPRFEALERLPGRGEPRH